MVSGETRNKAMTLTSIFGPSNKTILDRLNQIEANNEKRKVEIMAKLSSLTEQLAEIKKNQDEANVELRTKIDDLTKKIGELETQLGDVEIPEAAQTLLDEVKTGAKALADIIPNPTP